MKPANDSTLELSVATTNQSNEVARRQPEVLDMIQTFLDKGVTQENVAALRELAALKRDMDKDKAERDFAKAFVQLQAEMPNVKAMSFIPNNDGKVRSKFASYEEIMEQVAPLLKKHDFTVSFSTDFKEGRLIKVCTLQHSGGHFRTNSFAVRIGSGPPKASEAQSDGAASTYAKRFVLCDCLNIVVDKDTDAAIVGDLTCVTPEQADELERRAHETNSNINAFLKLAAAASFKNILAKDYDMLDRLLIEKENRGR